MSDVAVMVSVFLAIFVAGAAVGFFSRRLPKSGWAALALAVALPAVGYALGAAFC